MKKLLILSGKGGTGKTTTASAFIHFARAKAMADCDVDAPNLHLVMNRKTEPRTKDFIGAEKAVIDAQKCIGCGKCMDACRFKAVIPSGEKYAVREYTCEGCGVCAYVCPKEAVTMMPDVAGKQEIYEGDRVFSTAQLKMGRGNSGKLVTEVKVELYQSAPETELAIIDGSPGIGCPVIASVNDVDLALIVIEPSRSGLADLRRLVETIRIFPAKKAVCINRWDISPEQTQAIETFCREEEIPVMGRIPYDKTVLQAVNQGQSIADIPCPAREALFTIYENTRKELFEGSNQT